MATGTRGKQPALVVPEDTTTSPSQQLAIRAFSPEQETALDALKADIKADIRAEMRAAIDAQTKSIMNMMKDLLNGKDRQDPTDPAADILPTIETSPPAPPPAPAAIPLPASPPQMPQTLPWNPYKKLLRAEDVGFFDPEFQASEQEHGKTTPGPVVNAGKHVYYLDVFVFVDRLNELNRKHGPDRIKDVIPSCLRGSALTWWTTEVDDPTKTILEASGLDQWLNTLIRQFCMNPAKALAALTRSRYTLRDLPNMSPRVWIHGQLSLARSADLGSTYNQLTMIWNQMAPYFQEQLAQPSPTTLLSDFLNDVDAKTTVWQNRANELQRQQSRASHQQDRPRDSHGDAQKQGQPPAQPSRGVHFNHRPRIYRGKEQGKETWSYLVDTTPDGTPRWADEDPEDPLEKGDDYAEYG